MTIIIILAILTAWIFPSVNNVQPLIFSFLDKQTSFILKLTKNNNNANKLSIHIKNYFTNYINSYICCSFIFILMVCCIYFSLYKIHYIFDYILCIACLSMPIDIPWKTKFEVNS